MKETKSFVLISKLKETFFYQYNNNKIQNMGAAMRYGFIILYLINCLKNYNGLKILTKRSYYLSKRSYKSYEKFL